MTLCASATLATQRHVQTCKRTCVRLVLRGDEFWGERRRKEIKELKKELRKGRTYKNIDVKGAHVGRGGP